MAYNCNNYHMQTIWEGATTPVRGTAGDSIPDVQRIILLAKFMAVTTAEV